jgi:hypothetical protein
MKHQLINRISVGLFAILSVYSSVAQETSFKELPAITLSSATTTTMVSAKVNKMFSQYFKDATSLKWYELEKKLLVKFTMNNQEHRALFTRTGELVYHITFGTEEQLPADVRKQIRSTYYDQKITRVYEVHQGDRTVWIASLEDDNNYITARVEDYELDEIQRMTKSK